MWEAVQTREGQDCFQHRGTQEVRWLRPREELLHVDTMPTQQGKFLVDRTTGQVHLSFDGKWAPPLSAFLAEGGVVAQQV